MTTKRYVPENQLHVDIIVGKVSMVGTVKLPSDDAGTLEVLAEVIRLFSDKCGIDKREVLSDISQIWIKNEKAVH